LETWEEFLHQSYDLAAALTECVAYQTYDDSDRIKLSDVLASLAFEHSHSARILIGAGLLPSALVVHRSQFEALLRSLWALYGASDEQVAKLHAELTLETDLASKNIPMASKMMEDLAIKAPPNAYKPLHEFKNQSWGALNSYVHAGIHPIRRHAEGYPLELLVNVMKNVNGLMVVTAMQAAILTGVPNLQLKVLQVANLFPRVVPPAP
jgi:hypothetical protein